MSDEPLVTVVIPVRNEAVDLGECLERVLAQSWPHERLEVVVADGDSTDGTAEIARSILDRSGIARWEVVANPKATTPSNLNRGLDVARGEYVCRVDARSLLPRGYVTACVEVLRARPDVIVVGGRQQAQVTPSSGLLQRGIARALRNPYVTGFSRYRRTAASGPSDTVYLGFFRTADLRSVGGWDERFHTNQDYELNERLGRQGMVWYDAALVVGYRPRPTLGALFRQYRRFGRWKASAWLEGDLPIRPRQLVLLAVPPAALGLGMLLVRERPLVAVVLGGVVAAVVDAGTGEPADPAERACALLASAVIVGGWWGGVAEQGGRHVTGQRLLDGAASRAAPASDR